jgi:hypothetical protein
MFKKQIKEPIERATIIAIMALALAAVALLMSAVSINNG